LSTVELNGVTVYASAVESVEDGVSDEYNRLWRRYVDAYMLASMYMNSGVDLGSLVAPNESDHPAVVVKLTSGREFRIVGKTRAEVERDIFWAKRGHKR
jgi:hypothetical protein